MTWIEFQEGRETGAALNLSHRSSFISHVMKLIFYTVTAKFRIEEPAHFQFMSVSIYLCKPSNFNAFYTFLKTFKSSSKFAMINFAF